VEETLIVTPHGEAEVELQSAALQRLAFKVESQERRRPREGDQREHWRRAIDVEGDAEIAGMARIGTSMQLVESRRSTKKGLRTLLFRNEPAALQDIEADLEFSVSSLDERLRLTVRHGSSKRERTRRHVDPIGPGRLSPSPFATERWGNDQIGLRPGSALPRRSGRYYGVTGAVGSGPVVFELSQTERRTDDRARRHDDRTYEATAILDLHKLGSAIGGDGLGDSVWGIAPRSAWASWSVGSVDPGNAATGTRDGVQSYGAGLSWWWGAGYADLGLWHYHYDSRQRGGEDADWLGQGMYGGLGLYGSTWSVDAGLAFGRGNYLELHNQSQDVHLDGNLTFSLRPAEFPDVRLGVFAGRYDTDYIAYGGASRSGYWELRGELDLSKFLPGGVEPQGPGLSAVYGFRSTQVEDDFIGRYGEVEHVFGVFYRLHL
jgi:hypothetical protein